MAKDARPGRLSYGRAVGLTGLATVVRWVLTLLLGSTAPFAVFVMVTAVTALIGGLGPALVTTVAGATIALFVWLLPDHSIANFNTTTLTSLLVYLALSVFISILIDLMRRAQRHAEENAHALNESRKLLSTTLGSIGDAVIATDMQGHVTFMNQVAE